MMILQNTLKCGKKTRINKQKSSSFVLFHFSLFLVFENVMYFLTSIILFIWINNYVIKPEEEYLTNTFGDEYTRYKEAVSKWIIF